MQGEPQVQGEPQALVEWPEHPQNEAQLLHLEQQQLVEFPEDLQNEALSHRPAGWQYPASGG